MSYYAAIWLDHHQAKVFHVTATTFEEETIRPAREHTNIHRKSGPGAESGHRAPEDQHYYHDVAKALEDAQEILVLGPATAKLEFIKHVHKHHHAIEPKIIGVETVDHPTDRQIVTYARQYFKAVDQRQ
jgi:stalled ribosome rescue protein Dom34